MRQLEARHAFRQVYQTRMATSRSLSPLPKEAIFSNHHYPRSSAAPMRPSRSAGRTAQSQRSVSARFWHQQEFINRPIRGRRLTGDNEQQHLKSKRKNPDGLFTIEDTDICLGRLEHDVISRWELEENERLTHFLSTGIDKKPMIV